MQVRHESAMAYDAFVTHQINMPNAECLMKNPVGKPDAEVRMSDLVSGIRNPDSLITVLAARLTRLTHWPQLGIFEKKQIRIILERSKKKHQGFIRGWMSLWSSARQ